MENFADDAIFPPELSSEFVRMTVSMTLLIGIGTSHCSYCSYESGAERFKSGDRLFG